MGTDFPDGDNTKRVISTETRWATTFDLYYLIANSLGITHWGDLGPVPLLLGTKGRGVYHFLSSLGKQQRLIFTASLCKICCTCLGLAMGVRPENGGKPLKPPVSSFLFLSGGGKQVSSPYACQNRLDCVWTALLEDIQSSFCLPK